MNSFPKTGVKRQHFDIERATRINHVQLCNDMIESVAHLGHLGQKSAFIRRIKPLI